MKSESAVSGYTTLEALLSRTIEALTVLDAAAIEDLLEACGRVTLPESPEEWAGPAGQCRVLRHLLGSTGRHLAVLHSIATPSPPFCAYGSGRSRH